MHEAKLSFLRTQVLIDENNEYHLKPKGIAKTPLFSKMINSLALIRKEVNSDVVYYGKEYYEYSYVISALGTSKKIVDNTQRFKHLQGNYKRITELKNNEEIAKSLKILVSNNDIVIKINLESRLLKLYLTPISEHLFIIQGYGRYALSTVSIKEDSMNVYVTLFGITMKKI